MEEIDRMISILEARLSALRFARAIIVGDGSPEPEPEPVALPDPQPRYAPPAPVVGLEFPQSAPDRMYTDHELGIVETVEVDEEPEPELPVDAYGNPYTPIKKADPEDERVAYVRPPWISDDKVNEVRGLVRRALALEPMTRAQLADALNMRFGKSVSYLRAALADWPEIQPTGGTGSAWQLVKV